MNFLRNFLQGKEANLTHNQSDPQTLGSQHLKLKEEKYGINAGQPISLPLNSNHHNFSEKSENSQEYNFSSHSCSENLDIDIERKKSEYFDCPEKLHVESIQFEQSTCINPSPLSLSHVLNADDLNFEKHLDPVIEISAENSESEVSSPAFGSPNQLNCVTGEQKASEEPCNFLELTFEKPTKPPPKNLGKKQQNRNKRKQRAKNKLSRDLVLQNNLINLSDNVVEASQVDNLNNSQVNDEKLNVDKNEDGQENLERLRAEEQSENSSVGITSPNFESKSNLTFDSETLLVKDSPITKESVDSSDDALNSVESFENTNSAPSDNLLISSVQSLEIRNSVEKEDNCSSKTNNLIFPCTNNNQINLVTPCEEEDNSSIIVNPIKVAEVLVNTSDQDKLSVQNEQPKVLDCNNLNALCISSYSTDEFERLGHEANQLVEELNHLNSSDPLSVKMEERDSIASGNEETSESPSSTTEVNNIEVNMRKTSSKKNDCSYFNVNQSEAGPEIATGLTSSDLKCASQFFKEAAELESQIRKNIAATSLSSLNDFQETERSSFASESDRDVPSSCPPNEERSAPEGTSSPDPRSLEDSEVRTRRSTEGQHSNHVNESLKKQALKFEEKLLRQSIAAAETEKQLNETIKEEKTQLQKVTASRDALLKLVEQYKGMLAALVSEKEKQLSGNEKTIRQLETERTQAFEDLANVEAAFSDVHRKYERTKQIVDTLRRNEETLRNAVAGYEEKLVSQEKKYVELQKHAESKVREANEEFESLRRGNDQEMIKMSALLKKAEMKIISLQEALDRKTRENQELTQLCDDLINKVGS